MKVPDLIRQWNGVDLIRAGMRDAGFQIPERFVAFSASIVERPVEEWRQVLSVHATNFVRAGGDVRTFDPRSGEVHRMHVSHVLEPKFRDLYASQLHEWFAAEAKSDEELQSNWSEKRVHLRTVAQRLAKSDGFIVTKTGYTVPLSTGLILDVEIEAGRPGSTVQQFTPSTRLHDENGDWAMWLPWGELVPGIDYYMNGSGSCELCWGIKAFAA